MLEEDPEMEGYEFPSVLTLRLIPLIHPQRYQVGTLGPPGGCLQEPLGGSGQSLSKTLRRRAGI